jgi:hypothetical protein
VYLTQATETFSLTPKNCNSLGLFYAI